MKISFTFAALAVTAVLAQSSVAHAKCYSGNSIRSGSVKVCFMKNNRANVCIDGRCSNYTYTGSAKRRSVGGFMLEKQGSGYVAFHRGRRWGVLK